MKKLICCLIGMLLAANLSAGVFSRKNVSAQCGIKVVSYKFVGNAGTEMVYGNQSFTIPQGGVIELVAQKNQTSFQIGGKSFEIPQNGAADEFGSVTVELYRAASQL